MRDSGTASIRLRLVGLVLGCEAMLIMALGGILLHQQGTMLVRAFDSGLQSNAESLATLVEYDAAEGRIELEFSDEVMTRFSRRKPPDLFVVFGPEGRLLESSRSLPEVPDWVRPSDAPFFREFEHEGLAYRGLILPSLAESGDEEGWEGPRVPIHVFFATCSEPLNQRLADSRAALALAAGTFLLVSAAGVWWAGGRGLAAVADFARQARRINEHNLQERFDPSTVPAELQPLAQDFNGVLQRLEDAFGRERRFSGDAAHELRTPVASLKAGIQAALLHENDAASARGVLQDLLADTERLESLCEALLDLARAESHLGGAEVMGADEFRDAVREAVAALRDQTPGNLALEEHCEGGAPSVRASHATVGRIVSNLVGNAIRHAGEGSEITVRVAVSAGSALLAVEDDGRGIPEAARAKLFERFFRVEGHRARTTGGAGLGLSICRALARKHGGELAFEPREPRGSRFVWQLASAPGDQEHGE